MYSLKVKNNPIVQPPNSIPAHLSTCSIHKTNKVLFISIDPASTTEKQNNSVCLKCETCLLEGDLEESYLLSISQVLNEYPNGILQELEFFRMKILMDMQAKGKQMNITQTEQINTYCRNFIKNKNIAIEKYQNELIKKFQMVISDINTSKCIIEKIQEFKRSQDIKNNTGNTYVMLGEQEYISKTIETFRQRVQLYQDILKGLEFSDKKVQQYVFSNQQQEHEMSLLENDFSLLSDYNKVSKISHEISSKKTQNTLDLFVKEQQKHSQINNMKNYEIQESQQISNFLNNMDITQLCSYQSELLLLLADQKKVMNQIMTEQNTQGIVDDKLKTFNEGFNEFMNKQNDLNDFFTLNEKYNGQDQTIDTILNETRIVSTEKFQWKRILGQKQDVQISQTEIGQQFFCNKHSIGIIISNRLNSDKIYEFKCKFKKPFNGCKGIQIGLYDDTLNPPIVKDNNFNSLVGQGARKIILGDYLNGEELNKELTVVRFRICIKQKLFYIFDEDMKNINQGSKEEIKTMENNRIGVFLDNLKEELEFAIECSGY